MKNGDKPTIPVADLTKREDMEFHVFLALLNGNTGLHSCFMSTEGGPQLWTHGVEQNVDLSIDIVDIFLKRLEEK